MKPCAVALCIGLVLGSTIAHAEQFGVSASFTCFAGMVGDPKLTKVLLDNDGLAATALGVSPEVAREFYEVVLDGPSSRFAVVQRCDGAIASFLTQSEPCALAGDAIGGLNLKAACPSEIVDWADAEAHGQINCRFTEKENRDGSTRVSGSCVGAAVAAGMPCDVKLRFAKRFEPEGLCPK